MFIILNFFNQYLISNNNLMTERYIKPVKKKIISKIFVYSIVRRSISVVSLKMDHEIKK